MKHALVIGHGGFAADAAMVSLWSAGYQSIIRASNAEEALSLLDRFHPELILVLPDRSSSLSMVQIRRIEEKADAPIIAATSSVERALECLGPTTSLESAYALPHPAATRQAAMSPMTELRAA